MSECTFCYDFFILDSCVLETVKSYLKDNPIQCSGCNLHITHDCMYVWNTGSVISKHLLNHVNDHKTFADYYEIYKREGHVSISMNVFFKKCRLLVRDTEFIAQLIPTIIEQQFCPVKVYFVHVSTLLTCKVLKFHPMSLLHVNFVLLQPMLV